MKCNKCVKLVTVKKMKKIYIGEKEYAAKRVIGFSVNEKGGFMIRRKSKVMYSEGLAVVFDGNGFKSYFYIGEKTEREFQMLYYVPDNACEEIVLLEDSLQDNWDKVFLFFFDDEGAVFLNADRKLIPKYGARCVSVGEEDFEETLKEALYAAKCMDTKAFDWIELRLNSSSAQSDRSFLEAKKSNG